MQIVGSNLQNAFSNSLPILHDRQATLIYTHDVQCTTCEQQGNKPASLLRCFPCWLGGKWFNC